MTGTRTKLREIAAALAVLTIVFLNFAHTRVAAPPAGASVLTLAMDAGVCGDPLSADADHAPCHACRIGGGAALPDPGALAVPDMPLAVGCPQRRDSVADYGWPASARPRAPPLA